MKALIVEVPFTLMENAREQYKQNLKESIKKDIEEDGIVVLFGNLRSYVADVEDIVVKMKEEEEPVKEVKGCRRSLCRHFRPDYYDLNILSYRDICMIGNKLDFDEVCPFFISK